MEISQTLKIWFIAIKVHKKTIMQIINLLLMISLCFCMRMYIETIGLNINNETYSEQTNSHKYFKTVKNSSVDKVACRTFASAAHLAAYVGLAPVSRCSG